MRKVGILLAKGVVLSGIATSCFKFD